MSYSLEFKYNNLENILLQLAAETGYSFVVSYNGNTARLESPELPCLIATASKELGWLITGDGSDAKTLAENNYSIVIKENNKDLEVFKENAVTESGVSYIKVTKYLESTMELIARDLLKDIIPNKGAYSDKPRKWENSNKN